MRLDEETHTRLTDDGALDGQGARLLVGDTQRITVYAERGFAISQDVPSDVDDAYSRLVEAGYTKRLVRVVG